MLARLNLHAERPQRTAEGRLCHTVYTGAALREREKNAASAWPV